MIPAVILSKEINTNSVTKYHDKSKVFIIMCETLHFEGYILLFTAAASRNKINNNKNIIQFNFYNGKNRLLTLLLYCL